MRLYDPFTLLKVRPEVAKGYIVLLTGSPTLEMQSGKQATSFAIRPSNYDANGGNESLLGEKVLISDERLAFAALTDGNVLDSCFGVKDGVFSYEEDSEEDRRKRTALRSAKAALRVADNASESFASLSIQTYIRCFRIVIGYNESRSRGFWSWFPFCLFGQKAAQKKATNALSACFKSLSESIDAST